MRVFVVTSFDYGVGHSRPLCAFEAGVDAHRHASEQDLQEDSAVDEHRVTELVLIPEVGGEPIPTRDELRELREKAGKWDAAQAICDEYVEQFEHGDDVRGYMDQMGFLPKHRDNPRKATP